MADEKKRLIALEPEDLDVISALCQDAVMKVGGVRYLPSEKRFVMELRRFNWEKPDQPERRLSVLHFERVNAVAAQGINPKEKDRVLSLLAIRYVPSQSPAGRVELIFAGDFAIRLEVDCIEAKFSDMDAAWAAAGTPRHPVD